MESLRPIVAAQRTANRERQVWEHLSPTAQRVILAEIASNCINILSVPPKYIHLFLNARNTTALQADYALTYAGHNPYLPTSFLQALLQGHILEIPDLGAPTGMSPLLTPPASSRPANSQHRSMRIQFLLVMGQYCLSKEEEGELLDQSVHVVTTTQDLRHGTRNFVRLIG